MQSRPLHIRVPSAGLADHLYLPFTAIRSQIDNAKMTPSALWEIMWLFLWALFFVHVYGMHN